MKIFCTVLFVCFSCIACFAQDLIPKDWPHLKGYWKYQDVKNLTKPTVGNPLTLVGTHQQVAGPAYGDTAIRIAVGSYYKCRHGISPNGGGDSVNRYTLMFDFKVLSFKKWHTFFQTDTTNKNDGECFIRPITESKPARIGTATTKYTNDSIFANKWYRLVISVNLDNFYRYYINGNLWLEGDTQEVDDRFALLPQLLLFADNDKEDDTIDIASVAIFDTCLSSKDIAKIGTIEPCIANPPKINLGKDTILCANNSISLDAGLSFTKYQWSTGTKLPFETVDVNSLGMGKRPVWVKVTDANGCLASDTIFITYLALPKVDIGKDTAFCKGQIVKLTGGTDLSNKYLWKLMPKGVSLSSSNSITPDSSGKYMVEVTSINTCQNTDTINILVYQNPGKPKINIIGNTSLCQGDSVRLEGPGSFSAYNWSNGTKTQLIYISKTGLLTLKVTDKNSCVSPVSDTIKVIVHPKPPAPVIQSTGNGVFCDGDSLTLSATLGYKEYIWQDGIGTAIRIIKNATIYNVYVKDANDCFSPVSTSIFITVLTSPAKPKITIGGKTMLCEGETSKLSAPINFQGYVWSDSIKVRDNIIVKSGNYSVLVKGSNGCPSPWSDIVNITVNPVPMKPKVLTGSKDSLKSNAIAGRYKWFLNNSILPDTMFSIYAVHSGFFQVQIAEKGCWSKVSDSLYYKNLGIKEKVNSTSKLLISPNPVNTTMIVRLTGNSGADEVFIAVFDLLGKKVLEDKIPYSDLSSGVPINMEKLKKGIYEMRVQTISTIYFARIQKL